jgi:hypothetical protein
MKQLLGFALLIVIAVAAAPATGRANPPVRVVACQTARNFMDSGSPFPFSGGAWTWAMLGDNSGPYYMPMDDSYFHNYEPSVLRGGPTLAVDYSNQTASVIRSIEFGVMTRGRLIAEFQDAGTFSPATEISHDFRIPNLGSGGLTCVPLRVTFSDGSTWNSSQP